MQLRLWNVFPKDMEVFEGTMKEVSCNRMVLLVMI